MAIRLVVTISAAPGKGAQLAEAYKGRCAEVMKEPGCEQFEVFQSVVNPDRLTLLERWADVWYAWNGAAFVRSYQEHTAAATILPASADEFETLLADFLLERALRELAYELEDRPKWAAISIRAIRKLVGQPAAIALS